MSTRGTRTHTPTNEPGPSPQPGAGRDTAAPNQPTPPTTQSTHQPEPDAHTPKAPPPTLPKIQARSANEHDVDEICRLVNAWADEGLTLRRYQDEVRECIGEFVVVEWAPTTNDDEPASSPDPAAQPVEPTRAGLIACGALAVFSPNLGEIRSVAVDTAAKGTGAGRHVVQFMLDQAILLELDAVVLLTRIPPFFAKFGFHEVGPEEVPTAFIEEAIAGRGRTIEGRIIMLRSLL